MRWPIAMCKVLGRTTAAYRWFAVLYLLTAFFFLPGLIMGITLVAGNEALYAIGTPFAAAVIAIIIINVLQSKAPRLLPKYLRNWNRLPLWMRSLEPLDRLIRRCCFCFGKYNAVPNPGDDDAGDGGMAMADGVKVE